MPSATVDILARALATWDMHLDDLQTQRFARYAEMLVDWNANRANLTRLISPEQIAIQHFLDSIALFKVTQLPRGVPILDIGTGAGFPGLALKIFRPDLSLTLMEATAKKLEFCRAVADDLGFGDVRLLHGRAEDPRSVATIGATQSMITARAVAPMTSLLEWVSPYLGGARAQFVAWKGPAARQELHEARAVAYKLKMKSRVHELALPMSGDPLRVHSYIVTNREVDV